MFKVFVLVWLLLKEKFNHDMKWYFQREERAQRTLKLPPTGKKKTLQKLQDNHPQKKINIKHTKFELLSTKSKLSDRMMALCSHCHLGPGVQPSAMSPTLQLSTFIKRLQTPLHAHWQDWGKPTEVG